MSSTNIEDPGPSVSFTPTLKGTISDPDLTNQTHQSIRIDIDPSIRSTAADKSDGKCRVAISTIFWLTSSILVVVLGVSLLVAFFLGSGSQHPDSGVVLPRVKNDTDLDLLFDNSKNFSVPHPQEEETEVDYQEEDYPEEITEIVSNILNSMNQSVDPCSDFYAYSCGNWQNFNPRPTDYIYSEWSGAFRLDYRAANALHGLLMEKPHMHNDSIRILYQNCVGDGPTSLTSVRREYYNTTKPVVFSEMTIRNECMKIVESAAGRRAIERLYLNNIILDDVKLEQVKVIVENVQYSLVELIGNSKVPLTKDKGHNWKVTARKIKHFLEKVVPCVGYFKDLLIGNSSEVYWTDVKYLIAAQEYIQTHFSDRFVPEILNNLSPTCFWNASPFKPIAQYAKHGRSIELSYTWLQDPYFDHSKPSAMNYGAIGATIGHELAHAIGVDRYQRFNDTGPVLTCLINQYSKFNETIGEINTVINGKGTLEENFSDNLGVRAAFDAYQSLSYTDEMKWNELPGLEAFSDDQLFFLSYAQIWCSDISAKGIANQMHYGSHSPNKFRVLGTLRNSEEFAPAFKCQKASEMNPVDKCLLV